MTDISNVPGATLKAALADRYRLERLAGEAPIPSIARPRIAIRFHHMVRRSVTVRVRNLHDSEDDSDLAIMTPAERIALVWQLTVDSWAFLGEPIGESRLSRDVGRVVQRGS